MGWAELGLGLPYAVLTMDLSGHGLFCTYTVVAMGWARNGLRRTWSGVTILGWP